MAPGTDPSARSRWPEWAISLAIVALFAIGVASIWGAPIRRWIRDLTGEQEAAPPIGPPSGPRL